MTEQTASLYIITCAPEGALPHYYVGQTTKPAIRWTRHRYLLKVGKHHNYRMQRLWNKLGPAAFSFKVIDTVPLSEINHCEQWWLDEVKAASRSLNVATDAVAPARGFKFTDEMRRNVAASRPAKLSLSPEQRLAISQRMSGKNSPLFGKSPSAETRKLISESKKGKKNHFYGKSSSASPVARAVEGTCIATGEKLRFNCIADARVLGFRGPSISRVCSGERKSHNGYTWEYVNPQAVS